MACLVHRLKQWFWFEFKLWCENYLWEFFYLMFLLEKSTIAKYELLVQTRKTNGLLETKKRGYENFFL